MVVILDGEGGLSDPGRLRKVSLGRGTVEFGETSKTVSVDLIAHPDSAQAEACAMFGAEDGGGYIADRQGARAEGYEWS